MNQFEHLELPNSEMGKLSKFLLSTIAFTSVNGQDSPNFQVTSCNADVSKDVDTLKGDCKG